VSGRAQAGARGRRPRVRRRALALPVVLALLGPAAAPVPARAQEPLADWRARVAEARDWARERPGPVGFALVDERGRVHGWNTRRVFPSASVFKAVALAAYLNAPGVRGRPLTRAERARLGPMIRESANPPADWVRDTLGEAPIEAQARRAGMLGFDVVVPWGSSALTAADGARFVRTFDEHVVARHRPYARELMATVVPGQRWGVPRAAPEGFTLLFKGGWRPTATGRLVNQVALLQAGDTRIGVAVLTDGSTGHEQGTRTVEGVLRRLLRGVSAPPTASPPA
jgi:hypothetical protein